MKVFLQHIVALLAVVVMAASCSKDRADVIPRSKMAAIYAEMLMTDQWINARTDVRRIADTSLVYEPILQKYGYSHKDYLKTVDKYMDDPERFSRILRKFSDPRALKRQTAGRLNTEFRSALSECISLRLNLWAKLPAISISAEMKRKRRIIWRGRRFQAKRRIITGGRTLVRWYLNDCMGGQEYPVRLFHACGLTGVMGDVIIKNQMHKGG